MIALKNLFSKMATIIRGKAPENIEQQCLQLCADYLSGQWLNISREQLIFKWITGGFTNQMYFCSLPYDMKSVSCEPKKKLSLSFMEKNISKQMMRHSMTDKDLLMVSLVWMLLTIN